MIVFSHSGWQCPLQTVLTSLPSLSWQNLNGVMVAVAELLSMKIPNSYEVLFPESPARIGMVPKKGDAEGAGECGRKALWRPLGNGSGVSH